MPSPFFPSSLAHLDNDPNDNKNNDCIRSLFLLTTEEDEPADGVGVVLSPDAPLPADSFRTTS